MKPITGGEFLIRKTAASEIFIPEEWTEEQLMVAQTCRDFITQEVSPILDRIDSMEEGKNGKKKPTKDRIKTKTHRGKAKKPHSAIRND